MKQFLLQEKYPLFTLEVEKGKPASPALIR